ncbi:MAG: 50S ribosomal protein L16 [Alphaproteobacteria bacterium]|nr:50S ribosomal protein L16 [Alphaproteobacteria bacterium]MDA7982566.1 50S ribosomal protein L16 [Alphaproteobacteria bacterium]MDA7983960.1 50S ribosomal protein L16 [Alphaproteobacteria bacterium]MDA7986954.1 50S ribosomal protein L16 [Alphaproteobacteria bacterium]MDA7988115.1 50S ribosomal protein L16 [Alphaproteobacteria bacterium]
MQQPKKFRWRKQHKGRIHGIATSGNRLNFGAYGLKATTPGRLSSRQIEASRRAVTRHMKRAGRLWIRVFPDIPVTKKPIEVRMGSGKGSPEWWAVRVHPGRILFELDGVDETLAREAFRLASSKLPVRTAFVKREGS